MEDIRAVYPGYGKEGLTMKVMDPPTPESEGITHLMPSRANATFRPDDIDNDDSIPFVDDSSDEDWSSLKFGRN